MTEQSADYETDADVPTQSITEVTTAVTTDKEGNSQTVETTTVQEVPIVSMQPAPTAAEIGAEVAKAMVAPSTEPDAKPTLVPEGDHMEAIPKSPASETEEELAIEPRPTDIVREARVQRKIAKDAKTAAKAMQESLAQQLSAASTALTSAVSDLNDAEASLANALRVRVTADTSEADDIEGVAPVEPKSTG